MPYRRLGALRPILDEGSIPFLYACSLSPTLVGLHRESRGQLFDRASMTPVAQASSAGDYLGLSCGSEGWLMDRDRFDVAGVPRARAGVRPGGHAFVERITAHQQVIVELVPRLFGGPDLYIRVARWRAHKRDPARGRFVWTDEVSHPGQGSAVELEDSIVVAMASGEIYRYTVDEAGRLVQRAQISVATGAYQVSTVGDALAVLVAPDVADTGGCLIPWAEGIATSTTRLVVVDHQLEQQWSVSVDFTVMQPPVALGDRCVGLFGRGLAIARGGEVLRSEAGDAMLRATAYRDGHVAVQDGSTIRIQTRDGRERQRLEPPELAGSLVSFPCIDEHGALWIADAERVWCAPPE